MSIAEYETYTRLKLLGVGSYGKAHLCQSIIDGSLCVIKELDLNCMSESEKRDTLKEAKILEVLKHPNIIRFREVYKTKKGRLCIVMDYADGGDLSKKVAEAKITPLQEDQILDWITQICLGLKHVHDRKILHRDLKSQNIFLTKSNVVKLGDFGIAKILNSTRENARTMIGTPYYLSPEIVDSQPYSFKSDIWSLGVILYELCTSKPPFDAGSIPQLALKITKGHYSPIPQNYSKELKNLVSMLLSVDPEKRPTVNQILKMPLIKNRIRSLISETIRNEELSRTILDKQINQMAKKLVNLDLKITDIKQILNDTPIPKSLLEKIQEKEKEKLKQADKIQNQKLTDIRANDFDISKMNYNNFNLPREVSPTDAKVGPNPTSKLQNIENKADFNRFLKKKKDQISIEFQPLNFDPQKRKDSQDSNRGLRTPGISLPEIKSKYSVSPPNRNCKVNKGNPTFFNPAKEPKANDLPKSNIGVVLNSTSQKSPMNAGNDKKIIFELKTEPDTSPEISVGDPSSCRNDRSEVMKFEKPEVRVSKSPRNIFIQYNQRANKKQAKEDKSSLNNISYSKENNINNANIGFRRESVSPLGRPPLKQLQQQKQSQEKGQPLAKLIGIHLKKRQEGREPLNRFKESKNILINIFSDLHRKEKEMSQQEGQIKTQEDNDFRRKSVPESGDNKFSVEQVISKTSEDLIDAEMDKMEVQTPKLGQREETKLFQETPPIKNQKLVDMMTELQKDCKESEISREKEQVKDEKVNADLKTSVLNQSNLKSQINLDTIKDISKINIYQNSSFDEDFEFQAQGFRPILAERLELETIVQAGQICKSKLDEITHSVKEINTDPFDAFENEINRLIQCDDFTYWIPLLIIEGFLRK